MSMNKKLHFTMYFYLLSTAIRDTIEYCLTDKDKFDVDSYNVRKTVINNALVENSQFFNFCKNNGEVGEKIMKQISDLKDLVYGNEPKFIRINKDNLEIDHSLNNKVLDLICPLHFSCRNMTIAHYKGLDDEDKSLEYEQLIMLESKYFVLISELVLGKLIFIDRFNAFNESMKNNKGQENVESNFIVSEMTKLAGIHNWIRDNEAKEVKEYEATEVFFTHGFKVSSGEMKPAEGKTIFTELLDDVRQIGMTLSPIEVEYHNLHNKLWKELTDYEEELKKAKHN